MRKFLRILFPTFLVASCASTSSPETSLLDEWEEAVLMVALETVRQDEAANSPLLNGLYEIDPGPPASAVSFPGDTVIQAWWTDHPIYFSMNETESRIDVLALNGDGQALRLKTEYWINQFGQRDYEDLADYTTEIIENPRPGVTLLFRLRSDYPRP